MAYVAVDIGHGSNTFPPSKGVYKNGKGYAEHSFNAKVGMRIKAILEANGVKVILGQQPNKPDVNLTTRTNLYNREKVDLVFSIHANAGEGTGRCAFYWHTSSASKKLAETVIEHIKAKGYSTHGNGLHASIPNTWTNLHICRETSSPAVLVEHGFMDTDSDFELIFGSKQAAYVEDMAQADAAAIMEYLDVKGDAKVSKPKETQTGSTQITKPSNKSVTAMADEVIAGKHGSGHGNRRKNLGISKSEYEKVRAEVNRKAGTTSKPAQHKYTKTINQMAKEVIAGKHGSGHATRKASLGVDQSTYDRVRAVVNKLAAGGKSNSSSGKTISQMATEVIKGVHGSGNENRRQSLGISKSEYEKVRKEVNKRL